MSHSFLAGSSPLVFAHRGGAALAPENTFPALDRGLACGADGLEVDVRLSRDGIVVVHHDANVDRTTNRRGAIAALTADELARADAGFHCEVNGRHPFRGLGIGVPTLAAVLARYPDVRVIIEMKVNSRAMAHATLAVVRAADALDRVCLGAYGWHVLRTARAVDPLVATSASREEVRWALYRSWCRWPLSRGPYVAFQVPERRGVTRIVSPRFVAAVHAAGCAVHVWTVNAETDAGRLLSWGADALITDRPDVIVPFVRGFDRVSA